MNQFSYSRWSIIVLVIALMIGSTLPGFILGMLGFPAFEPLYLKVFAYISLVFFLVFVALFVLGVKKEGWKKFFILPILLVVIVSMVVTKETRYMTVRTSLSMVTDRKDDMFPWFLPLDTVATRAFPMSEVEIKRRVDTLLHGDVEQLAKIIPGKAFGEREAYALARKMYNQFSEMSDAPQYIKEYKTAISKELASIEGGTYVDDKGRAKEEFQKKEQDYFTKLIKAGKVTPEMTACDVHIEEYIYSKVTGCEKFPNFIGSGLEGIRLVYGSGLNDAVMQKNKEMLEELYANDPKTLGETRLRYMVSEPYMSKYTAVTGVVEYVVKKGNKNIAKDINAWYTVYTKPVQALNSDHPDPTLIFENIKDPKIAEDPAVLKAANFNDADFWEKLNYFVDQTQ